MGILDELVLMELSYRTNSVYELVKIIVIYKEHQTEKATELVKEANDHFAKMRTLLKQAAKDSAEDANLLEKCNDCITAIQARLAEPTKNANVLEEGKEKSEDPKVDPEHAKLWAELDAVMKPLCSRLSEEECQHAIAKVKDVISIMEGRRS